MKKLMFAALAATAFTVFADEAKQEAQIEKQEAPLFWGFANYGVYSGYLLYGSLVNNEPTAQGYVEENMNLAFADIDFGYLGAGVWSNTDLTKRRRWNNLGNAFNEWDFNVHYGRTFWFDDDKTWGLTYRTSVVWYYYPNKNYKGSTSHDNHNFTTIDWNHYFELQNPYVIPYINVVREWKKGANLLQFGVKKPFQITDQFSLCPILEMVWRESRYNWCFPTEFGGCCDNSGIATFKAELDGTYMFNDTWGVFAKFAFCSIIDPELRDNIDNAADRSHYGMYCKDFVWGGIGVCCNF